MTRTLVFIDSRVADHQSLIAGLGADAQWVLLDANRDGIDQMRSALAGSSGLESIQIVSHGSSGSVLLGSTVLDANSLDGYEAQLKAIGQSLSATGDLLLYGCNVAQGAAGAQFIDQLGQLTGADVAASTDLTGLGGNWTLEAATGAIEAARLAPVGYVATLDVITGTQSADTLVGSGGADTISGLVGNDSVDGLAGNDSIDGGYGDDTLVGGFGNDTLLGGAGNDSLTGGDDNDSLIGGAGADTLIGGAGDDSYAVDKANDLVIEQADEGTDQVLSSASFTLGVNVEHLELTGSAAITGTGNDLDNLITGNSAGNILDGAAGADTLIGGDGSDIYLVDDADDMVIETNATLARGGIDQVHSSVSYALGANVEDLTLTGSSAINGTGNNLANVITGNSAGNTLAGASGADTLDGDAGADTLIGGDGSDTYLVDDAGDVVTETNASAAGGRNDQVNASVNFTLGANLEHLKLTGSAATDGTGNALANRITGNSAGNILDGAGGADTLIGGDGSDTYVVDSAGDVVTETNATAASGGTDLVNSSVSYALGANVENLALTGSSAINGTGNNLANAITGNSAGNILTGAAGADTLDGDAGADTLIGGDGSDTYLVDDAGDIVTETNASAAGGGTDQVNASVSYTLSANVENLTLTGSAINGTGNALANRITGNAAANVLDGGAGSDTLTGGAGTDTARFSGVAASYTISKNGAGSLVVARPDGADVLLGIEQLQFDDALVQVVHSAPATEYRANTYVSSDQESPTVTALKDGGWLLTWSSDGQDGSGWGIYGQRYGADGVGSGSEFRINTYTAGWQYGASVTALSDGGWVASWSSNGQDGSGYGVYGQRYGADGVASGGELRANTYTPSHQAIPAVTALRDGGWVVTWNSDGQDGSEDGVFGQRYGADGVASGGEFRVNTYTAGRQGDPAVAALSDGGWVVMWDSSEQQGTWFGIYGQRYGADGVATGSEFRVGGTANHCGPCVTALSDGGWVVTWSPGGSIYAQRYGADGVASGSAFTVNTNNAGKSDGHWGSDPQVAALSDGGWVVTWDSLNQDGSGLGVYGQRYDAHGVASGGEFRINSYTAGEQFQSAVTALSDGGWVVTWTSDRQDGAGWGIYSQRYGDDGAPYTTGFDLRITGDATSQRLNGDSGNDLVDGGAGNDTLDGGAGDDALIGGAGDDTYIVDDAGDVVTETNASAARGGTDLVKSSVSYTLGANVENLTLTGSAASNGAGNDLANAITGNRAGNTLSGAAGADTLDGGDGADTLTGGVGADRLTGGLGSDSFRFQTTADGSDTITDFASGTDKIYIVAANFGLTAGAGANLVINGTPSSAAAAFVYSTTTGVLGFDSDGNGAGAAMQLATLSNKSLGFKSSDFVFGA